MFGHYSSNTDTHVRTHFQHAQSSPWLSLQKICGILLFIYMTKVLRKTKMTKINWNFFFFFFFLHLFYTLHFEILKSFLVGWWHCLLNFMSKKIFFFGEWVQPRFKSSFSIIFEKKKKKDVNIKTKMMINILEMKPYLKK